MAIYNHGLPIPRKKVESGGVDTSADTVTPSTLVKDYTAHDAEGKPIVGELDVDAVRDEGYAEGQTAGYSNGYSEGKTEGIEAGKHTEREAFWDAFLDSVLTQDNFNSAFAGSGWTDDTFKPNRSLQISGNAMNAFYGNHFTGDLVELFDSKGLEISFTNITYANNMFSYSTIIRIPLISFASGVGLNIVFSNNYALEKLDGIEIDHTNTFSATFTLCIKLVDLTIIGTIGQNGFNVSWSPLNKASLTSIVNALSATTTGLTVTLRLDAVNKAFETSEGAMDGSISDEWLALAATKANWTISLINS